MAFKNGFRGEEQGKDLGLNIKFCTVLYYFILINCTAMYCTILY